MLDLSLDWYGLSLSNMIFAYRKDLTKLKSTFAESAKRLSGHVDHDVPPVTPQNMQSSNATFNLNLTNDSSSSSSGGSSSGNVVEYESRGFQLIGIERNGVGKWGSF